MSFDTNELSALPIAEKMRIVEFLWDDLGNANSPIPLPDWVVDEASRRREEMHDPSFGLSHEETWHLIERRNG